MSPRPGSTSSQLSSRFTMSPCPFPAAQERADRPLGSVLSALISSRFTRCITTATCPPLAAQGSPGNVGGCSDYNIIICMRRNRDRGEQAGDINQCHHYCGGLEHQTFKCPSGQKPKILVVSRKVVTVSQQTGCWGIIFTNSEMIDSSPESSRRSWLMGVWKTRIAGSGWVRASISLGPPEWCCLRTRGKGGWSGA